MDYKFDVIIIGAGASGLACAASALRNGKKVAILEHNREALRKVAVSGGGRCNFTNLAADYTHYTSANSRFAISALKQFSPTDLLEFLQPHNFAYQDKAPGQLFCRDSSATIIKILQKETAKAHSFFETILSKIEYTSSLFHIFTNQGTFISPSLVVACGGASYPNLGASETGYQLARQFGLKVIPYSPALVPLNLDSQLMKNIIKLQGLALPAVVTGEGFEFKDNILFTHFGLSGPAILQASLYWQKGQPLQINLLPEKDVFSELKRLKSLPKPPKISTILKSWFPERLVEFILNGRDFFLAETKDSRLQEISSQINNWNLTPVGTQGFRLAEVTRGGVDVNELSSQTFESKKQPGLFFIGEVLDVTGQLGGYNLQWAFSSGFTAGRYV